MAHILNYALYCSYLYFSQIALLTKNYHDFCTIFSTYENNAKRFISQITYK